MAEATKSEEQKDGLSPSWIDIPLITEALKGFGEENPHVTGFTIRIATKPGDNYGSTIYRVIVTLNEGKMRTFLVKGPPPGGAISEMIKKGDVFEREGLMLADVIPKIEALLEEAAPGRWGPLAARCPLHSNSPSRSYIVMEDLAPPGFRLADKKRGLGLRHSLLALRALARYHAGSHVLLQREPELYRRLDNRIWDGGDMEVYLKQTLQTAADMCRKCPDLEDYANILENFKDIATDKLRELNNPKPGGFHVITHGDYWLNNMLFRYNNDGEVCDHRFVDLQISHVASPAIDVLYFLSGNTSEDVSTHNTDLLIRDYYTSLQEALTLLGQQAPTLEEFLSEIDAHGLFSLFFTLCGLPAMKAEKPPDIDSTFQGDNSGILDMYNNPEVQKWYKRLFPEYRRKGWLPE